MASRLLTKTLVSILVIVKLSSPKQAKQGTQLLNQPSRCSADMFSKKPISTGAVFRRCCVALSSPFWIVRNCREALSKLEFSPVACKPSSTVMLVGSLEAVSDSRTIFVMQREDFLAIRLKSALLANESLGFFAMQEELGRPGLPKRILGLLQMS